MPRRNRFFGSVLVAFAGVNEPVRVVLVSDRRDRARVDLGVSLVVGIFPGFTWLSAIFCFVCLAGLSSAEGMSGKGGCDCFGRMPIPPFACRRLLP